MMVFTDENAEEIGLVIPQDDDGDTPQFDFFDEDGQMPEANDVDFEAYDKFISAKVLLPSEGVQKIGTVRKTKRDEDSELIGRFDPDPIKDTSIYVVAFDNESSS